MTDSELKELYQYAKLGKAAMNVIDVIDKFGGSDYICTEKTDFLEDSCCIECEWHEFCKVRQEVDK